MALSDDNITHLVLSLEARTDQLDRAIANFSTNFDKLLSASERRSADFGKNLERSISGSLDGVKHAFETAFGVALTFEGLKGLVEHVTESVDTIKKQSDTLNLSTDTFQAWTLSALKSGVAQDQLSNGLDTFSKNLGAAQLKTTDFGRNLKQLGVDTHGGTEAAFYSFIDAVNKVGDVEQRNKIIGDAFGKGNVSMAAFIRQGSGAIREQQAEFKKNGEIISNEAIDKITELSHNWADLKAQMAAEVGATFVSGLAEEFGEFSAEIRSPEFQQGLRNMAETLAAAAVAIAKIAGAHPDASMGALLGATLGGKIGGPWGAVGGAAAGGTIGWAADNKDWLRMVGLQNSDIPSSTPGNWQYDFDITRSPKQKAADLLRFQAELDRLKRRSAGPDYDSGTAVSQDQVASDFASWGIKSSGGSSIDLTGSLDRSQSAYARAIATLKENIADLQQNTGAENNATEAVEKHRVQLELTTAAQEDAQRTGSKVSAAQLAQIDALSTAYAKLAAQRAFAGDLRAEDDRIAKLALEGQKADLTARALAVLESQRQQTADYQKRFGPDAVPDAATQSDIDARANRAGSAAAGNEMAKALVDAKKQITDLGESSATLGLFGAALAQAQMQQALLTAAEKAGVDVTPELRAQIEQLSHQYGEMTQAAEAARQKLDNQVALTDELRSGLESVGVAGLHGFDAMKKSASEFLMQLAEMILKLYVLQPILNALLGTSGTAGGGLLGGFLSSVTGNSTAGAAGKGAPGASAGILSSVFEAIGSLFADGGVMTSRGPMPLRRYSGGGVAYSPQVAEFAEGGIPEAYVPVPSGRIPVHLNMPRMAQARSAGSQFLSVAPVFNIDAKGAEIGVEQKIAAAIREAAPVIADHARQMAVTESNRRFRNNLHTTLRDQRV